MDKQDYSVYKAVKHFRPYLLKNRCVIFVPHPTVRSLLFQQEFGERTVNSMTKLQENDLEIIPVHTTKGHGHFQLAGEAVNAK